MVAHQLRRSGASGRWTRGRAHPDMQILVCLGWPVFFDHQAGRCLYHGTNILVLILVKFFQLMSSHVQDYWPSIIKGIDRPVCARTRTSLRRSLGRYAQRPLAVLNDLQGLDFVRKTTQTDQLFSSPATKPNQGGTKTFKFGPTLNECIKISKQFKESRERINPVYYISSINRSNQSTCIIQIIESSVMGFVCPRVRESVFFFFFFHPSLVRLQRFCFELTSRYLLYQIKLEATLSLS
jgi:hypothetical protein